MLFASSVFCVLTHPHLWLSFRCIQRHWVSISLISLTMTPELQLAHLGGSLCRLTAQFFSSPLIGNPTESYFFFFSVYFFSLQSIFFVISWIKKEYIGGKYFEISYIWKWLWFILHLCLINNMARYRILSWKAFSLRTWRHFSKALYFPVLLLKNSDTWYFIWRLFLISGNFRVSSSSPVSEIPWCQILLCSSVFFYWAGNSVISLNLEIHVLSMVCSTCHP